MDYITGLNLNYPSEADGIDTFQLGYMYDYDCTRCENACRETANCDAYTLFMTGSFYTWQGECMGRSNKTWVADKNDNVCSGRKYPCEST